MQPGARAFPRSALKPAVPAAVLAALLLVPATFASAATVRINEVMASNGSTIADEDGDFADWIELHNFGEHSVDLAGWGLSDRPRNPFKWTFPENTTLLPGGHLLVWASGKNRHPAQEPSRSTAELHTNFSLSAQGETLILTASRGTRVDALASTAAPRDVSLGRVADAGDSWFLFPVATPGATNDTTAYAGMLEPPRFSHPAGFYEADFTLRLQAPDDVTILYTLDGSEPNPENIGGNTYRYKLEYPFRPGNPFGEFHERTIQTFEFGDGIQIRDRTSDPDGISLITTGIPSPPPSGNTFKGTVVRARTIADGYLPSATATNTYFVHPGIHSRYTLPVISVATGEDGLFGYDEGIYVPGATTDQWRTRNPDTSDAPWRIPGNFRQRGRDWERPAHFELFEPSGTRILAQDLGIRIHGGATRHAPRKSLRLVPRAAYDTANVLQHPFFGPLAPRGTGVGGVDSFRRLVLRNSGNDNALTLYRDALIQELAIPLGLDQQAYQPAVHFINGEYWGVINIRERIDKHHLAVHHAIDPEDIETMSRNGGEVTDREQNDLLRFAREHDLSDSGAFAYLAEHVDIERLARYFALQIYIANVDWPQGNMDFWRKRPTASDRGAEGTHDGRWRPILFDTDFGLDSRRTGADVDTLERAVISWEPRRARENSTHPTHLFRSLLANDIFRFRFINLLNDMGQTVYEPARVSATVERFNARIENERAEHARRWHGGNDRGDSIIEFAKERPEHVRQQIIRLFGLPGEAELTVSVADATHGRVRLNTFVLDADTPGISDPARPYPWTGTYLQGVPVELEALPGDGYRFAGWATGKTDEAANAADFGGVEQHARHTGLPQAPGEDPRFTPSATPRTFSTESLIQIDLRQKTWIEALFEPLSPS